VVEFARWKTFGHQTQDRIHPVDVSHSMVEIDDQDEAAVDEIRLYRAAKAMVLFGKICKRCKMNAFDIARCKAAMADVVVAPSMALYISDGWREFFDLLRSHHYTCWLLLVVGGDRPCKHRYLTDKTLDGSLKPFGNDGRVSVIASETKSIAQMYAWSGLIEGG
jgi:hypothetical protein